MYSLMKLMFTHLLEQQFLLQLSVKYIQLTVGKQYEAAVYKQHNSFAVGHPSSKIKNFCVTTIN